MPPSPIPHPHSGGPAPADAPDRGAPDHRAPPTRRRVLGIGAGGALAAAGALAGVLTHARPASGEGALPRTLNWGLIGLERPPAYRSANPDTPIPAADEYDLQRDLLDLVTTAIGVEPVFQHLPWVRVQEMIRSGELDGTCTPPTQSRRGYARFTPHALLDVPYGLWVRVDDHRMDQARSLADLAAFHQATYLGNQWGQENLPLDGVETVATPTNLVSMVAAGRLDYFLGDAVFFAELIRSQGLADQLRFVRAPYLPTAPFGVAIRRSHPQVDALITALDAAIVTHRQEIFRLANRHGALS